MSCVCAVGRVPIYVLRSISIQMMQLPVKWPAFYWTNPHLSALLLLMPRALALPTLYCYCPARCEPLYCCTISLGVLFTALETLPKRNNAPHREYIKLTKQPLVFETTWSRQTTSEEVKKKHHQRKEYLELNFFSRYQLSKLNYTSSKLPNHERNCWNCERI